MNILGVLRSTYLYAALTIAGGAIVVAATGLLALALELAGLASTPPTPETMREQISGAVAIFIFAIPIGAVHLWLVRRSLSDPDERASGPRHVFLNGWIVVGLLMSVMAVLDLASVALVRRTIDLAFPIVSLLAGVTIALVGWRWRGPSRVARRDAQLVAAFATLGLATFLVATQLFTLLNAILYSVVPMGRPFFVMGLDLSTIDPRPVIWSSLVGLAAALGMWWIGLRWQWPWRDVAFRTVYAAVGYGVGLVLAAVPGSDALARVIGIVRGGADLSELRGLWELPIIGVVLVAMHLPWLVADRGRVRYPARVTDRLVRGIAALSGLAALTIAATAWGSVIVQDLLRVGPPQSDPVRVRDRAIATLLIALVLYPLPWRGFLRSTAADPRSGLRRAYLLFVAGVSLLGALVAGVISVSNAIQMALGAALSDPTVRDTVDAAGWAVIFAVVLAAHGWMLLRDMRAARATAPVATVPAAPGDPLVAILEDVAARRITVREAAASIRALTSPPGVTGKTA